MSFFACHEQIGVGEGEEGVNSLHHIEQLKNFTA